MDRKSSNKLTTYLLWFDSGPSNQGGRSERGRTMGDGESYRLGRRPFFFFSWFRDFSVCAGPREIIDPVFQGEPRCRVCCKKRHIIVLSIDDHPHHPEVREGLNSAMPMNHGKTLDSRARVEREAAAGGLAI